MTGFDGAIIFSADPIYYCTKYFTCDKTWVGNSSRKSIKSYIHNPVKIYQKNVYFAP